MPSLLRFILTAVVALAVWQPGAAPAQAVKQIPLTEQHIQGFIAAQKDMSSVAEKSQSDKPDPKVQAELEAVAKKHGFTSFQEYDLVAANIAMIMAGLDPRTKKFSEPSVAIQNEIKEVQADKSIPAKEKKQMLDELNTALKTAQPIQHRGNIDLVMKHYDKIEAALE